MFRWGGETHTQIALCAFTAFTDLCTSLGGDETGNSAPMAARAASARPSSPKPAHMAESQILVDGLSMMRRTERTWNSHPVRVVRMTNTPEQKDSTMNESGSEQAVGAQVAASVGIDWADQKHDVVLRSDVLLDRGRRSLAL
jgi:hypothetical protein